MATSLKRILQATCITYNFSSREAAVKSPFVPGLLLLFSLYFLYCLFTHSVPLYVLYVYVAASLTTCIMYCFDKIAAEQRAWRTSERTLHLMGLLCGWPGALLAQRLIRHKTSKSSFQFQFAATAVLNVVLFVIYSSPHAREFMLSMLRSQK